MPSVFGIVIMNAATSGPSAPLELAEVHLAVLVGAELHDLVARDGRRRRVRAVRRVGHEDLRPLLAPRLVIGADHEHARQLALRAGRRLQRHRVHAGDLGEHRASSCISRSAPCDSDSGVSGCRRAKPGKPRHVLVDLRVVLHRARAERVEARVEPVVHLAQAREVTDHVELGHLGQGRRLAAQGGSRQPIAHVLDGDVQLGQRVRRGVRARTARRSAGRRRPGCRSGTSAPPPWRARRRTGRSRPSCAAR